jgi:hypothetical protein
VRSAASRNEGNEPLEKISRAFCCAATGRAILERMDPAILYDV